MTKNVERRILETLFKIYNTAWLITKKYQKNRSNNFYIFKKYKPSERNGNRDITILNSYE